MPIVEAAVDGSFDVGAADDARPWDEIKAEGNALFVAKDFAGALVKYAAALEAAPQDQRHLLLGNRATCFFQLQHLPEALREVNEALALVPAWDKGLARKQCILKAMAAQKAMRAKSTAVVLGSMYGEKDAVLPDNDQAKPAHVLWRRLKASVEAQHQTSLDGVFAKLSNERDFVQLVYPGIPLEDVQRQKLPRSLRQLLSDAAKYEAELIALMPKVEAKANLVLENVKRKGAAMGDIMDAATEAALRPQVYQEAFARELLAMIQRVNASTHAALAQDSRFIADPTAECAHWDLIDDTVGKRLFADGAAFAVQDDFMGEEYLPLLLSDARRLKKQGKLLPVDQASMRFWTKESGLSDDFPALAEVVEKLQALPFALNRVYDVGLCDEAKLDVSCSTSLLCLEPGQAQPRRLDCGPPGDPSDNGYKLSCIYCLGDGDVTGGDLELVPLASGKVEVVLAKPDRLCLYKCQDVLNALTSVTSSSPMYYVVFRMHGTRPLVHRL
ncbi:hypothetical protein ACHHYP_16023 [Achlya hypogyna]|uniref:Uncharacterized protein n=1 Tax=Achlya hypogyna TaxID=1202772 RepID=A0A1V9ZEB4_ACHHY|nr:hypothetical protein ACHHYP_16023 [Achlya hypogyna]